MLKKFKLSTLFVFLILIFSITAVSASENTTDIQTISEYKTFTDLQNEVNKTTNELNITQDYAYNNVTDSNYTNGVTIENKTNYVINGNGHTLDGSNQVGILVAINSNVTINDLVFTNGKSYFSPGLFIQNSNVILNNVTFKNMESTDSGACLVMNGNITIKNSSFINTTAPHGGAITVMSSGTEIYNCEFKDSDNLGWGMIQLQYTTGVINNCSFANLNSNYTAAIYTTGTNAVISNSKFTNLTSKKTAGAIGAKESNLITITNSEFTNIISAKNGGSLFFDSIANVTIINSTFTRSSSEFGGAILQLEGNLTIENSNFTQNSATFDGGAIYASYVNLTMDNVNFINNKGLSNDESRGANGGSLYLDMTNTTITNSKFINNTATSNGGAIYTYDTSLFMNKTYFTNNSQSNTTGIYSAFDKNHTAINCNFTDDIISLNNTIYATIVDGTGVTLTLLNNSIIVTNLPSRFNLKDFNWVSSVKNQGSMNSCWTFGTCGSLESALLKATEVEYDFSENNFQNSMLKYSIYGSSVQKEGGDDHISIGYLVSWFGVFPTEYDSYDELGKISTLISTDEDIHIQDVITIHPRQNATDNDQIKKALIKYGALWIAYNAQTFEPYYNTNTSAQYYNETERPNHAVTLVGWDDNYSKNNFLITPPGDGAFIVKNSAGTSFGDKGYNYISYYDTSFLNGINGFGVILNNTVPYNKNYQVDISGCDYFYNANQSQISYANQFEALEDDLIAAVGTYFNNSDEKYEINIYVNDELKLTQSGVSAFSGFSTIKLNTYIPVKEGDIFKAVIKGVNIPLSVNTRAHNDKNTSFICEDGKTWNVSNYIVCLKVYTVANSIESSDLEKYYKNASKFSVNVNVANAEVIFNINGVNYTRNSDDNGIASMAINLRPGTYNITTYFNGINKTNKITVLSTIIADNLVKYYMNGTQFYAKFVDGNGNPLANTNVTFNINGVFYTRTTNTNGTAQLKLNLRPGNYTLTAIDPETGLEMSFNITILPTIIAHDITKVYLNETQFTAKFVKGSGEALANTNVTFNINGVFYTHTTDANGTAILNINLMPGKYILTAIDPLTQLTMGYNVTVIKDTDNIRSVYCIPVDDSIF